MEGRRAHLASPKRTKGALVGAHEDYIVGGGRASPGRTQVMVRGQGGPRARRPAPRRTKGPLGCARKEDTSNKVVLVSVVIVVAFV